MELGEKVDALRHTFGTRGWIDVIRPALEMVIAQTTRALISGLRAEGDKVTDDNLKGRIIALEWVKRWEVRCEESVIELEQLESVKRDTEPATEGGSPYA